MFEWFKGKANKLTNLNSMKSEGTLGALNKTEDTNEDEACVKIQYDELASKFNEEVEICIKNLQDKEKRISAIEKLGELKSKSSVEPLIKLLRSLSPNRYNAEERLEIVVAMGKIRDSQFIDPLIECLNDLSEPSGSNEVYRVCTNASYSLGKIGNSRAIAPLSAILQDTNIDYYRRSIAAKALALIDDKNSIRALKAVVHDPNEIVRNTALTLIKSKGKG